ncbi:MAG: MauE/DoxX family redox-associated membrane protein [Acidimicrobiales bacterium]
MGWLIVRVVLAATFGVAGAAKLASPAETRASFRSFGVLGAATGLAAVCVPLLEFATAGALLVTSTATAGAWMAFVLLVVFSVVAAAALARGEKPECGCFGALSSKRAGPGTFVRNAVLGAAAAACAIVGPGESVGRAPASAIAAGVLLVGLGALTAFSLQLMRQNGRLVARLEVLEASVLGATGVHLSAGEDGGQPVGSPAPDFLVWDEDESVHSLADLLAPGEPVILAFTDPECRGCRTIGPLLDRAREAGAQVALITRGDRGPLPGALRQIDREVMAAYRAYVVPSAVVVDADGRIASELARGADAVAGLLESTVSVA